MQGTLFNEKITNIFKWIILFCLGIICTYLWMVSLFETSNAINTGVTTTKDNILIHLVVLAGVLIVGGIFYEIFQKVSFKRRHFYIVLAIMSLCLMGLITFFSLHSKGDCLAVIERATKFIDKDYSSFEKGDYLYSFPNNIGITLYIAFFFKFFNATDVGMQYINVFFWAATMALIFEILNLCEFSKKKNVVVGIVICFFAQYSLYVTFVYGTIPGMAFAMLACFLLLKYFKTNKLWQMLLSVVAITVAYILKQNYLIVALAMIAMLVIMTFLKQRVKYLLWIPVYIIVMLGAVKAMNFCVGQVIGMEVSKGMPTSSWLAMGLRWEDEETPGWYDAWTSYTYITVCDCDTALMDEKSKEMIKYRLNIYMHNKRQGVKFLYKKINSMWNNPTGEALDVMFLRKSLSGRDELVKQFVDGESDMALRLIAIMNEVQSLLWAGVLLWLALNWKDIKVWQLLFAILFIGGFLFHIIWEVKALYAVPYELVILPFSVFGFMSAWKRINAKLGKNKNEKN